MKEPRAAFLIELCTALREAEHKSIAGNFAAGFLWTLYPEWFDKHWPPGKGREIESILEREYNSTFKEQP